MNPHIHLTAFLRSAAVPHAAKWLALTLCFLGSLASHSVAANYQVTNVITGDGTGDALFQNNNGTLLSGGIVAMGYFPTGYTIPPYDQVATAVADFTVVASAVCGSMSPSLGLARPGYVEGDPVSQPLITTGNPLLGRALYVFVGNAPTLAGSTNFALLKLATLGNDVPVENAYIANPLGIGAPVYGTVGSFTGDASGLDIPSTFKTLRLWSLLGGPAITNVRAAQRVGTNLVDIDYDVTGTTQPLKISLEVSADDGTTFNIPAIALSGAAGDNVTPGTNLRLTWDAGKDWGGRFSDTMRYKVVADDDPPPTGFALIPAGAFQMGDQSSPLVGNSGELPVHTVQVSAFYMGKYEVTKEEWDAVRTWGQTNGYTDLAAGNGTYATKGANHPVHSITWYDMVKWCDARSQKEGLVPCYTVSGATYKTGISDPVCNWSANGYRLPTEAEWEKAARGGVAGKNFPWGGDTITHGRANYNSSASYAYDVSPTRGYHPTYGTGTPPPNSPVGNFAPNGYGLYDMAGNMWEWCWDWYGSYAAGSQTDPRGAASGSVRVYRGGSCGNYADTCRVAYRYSGLYNPTYISYGTGFRLARSTVKLPSVVTGLASGITSSGATLGGTVNPNGLATAAQFEYGLTTAYGSTASVTLAPADGTAAQNVSATLTGLQSGQTYHYRLTATHAGGTANGEDQTFVMLGTLAPAGFALIPAGQFQMGDQSSPPVGYSSELPAHTVQVSAFYMGKYEVTKEEWDAVRTWGLANGYTDLPAGNGTDASKGANHPVHSISWYAMAKWCNARSQKENLTPCYTVAGATYQTGDSAPVCNWNANGYRLPTEAEWEKAARGGPIAQNFPWGNTISHSEANFRNTGGETYQTGTTGYHPTYATGSVPYSAPVGSFAANGYGLYDMTGNMWEWCWDWYASYTAGSQTDPQGAASGSGRVYRGGGWGNSASGCRIAVRNNLGPTSTGNGIGFRTARSTFLPPTVATGLASNITISEATLSGTVNPNGLTTTAQFQYGLTTAYGSTASVTLAPADGTTVQNVSATLTGLQSGQTYHYRLTATHAGGTANGEDQTFVVLGTLVPEGFALIPAGAFQMGDQSSPLVGNSNELPVHSVQVSAFYMGKYEVTKEEWDAVWTWGLTNGYTDLAVGNGTSASKGANHPVHSITWYDMVKWCNARSQKEGLTPCYTVSGATYKTGQSDPVCNWSANGYRLPTEAEWEKAARGGGAGKNFPWDTDTISHSQANYYAYSGYSYDLSGAVNNSHPTYAVGGYPYSSPVGSFAPNGYGLYDMAGNMWECCWDWNGLYAAGAQNDPRGAATGYSRVIRGGGWINYAFNARCAFRNNGSPGNAYNSNGFRLARGQP